MTQEVTNNARGGVPSYIPNRQHSVGNVDATDRVVPRLKLLHGINPEVETFESAKAGNFWHSIAEKSLGSAVKIVPIKIRKEYSLWAPRGDNRGRLARAVDCVNWDVKDDFRVKPKNAAEQVWSTKEGTVKGSRLSEWGSSIKSDANSQPAAALTYNMLVYLPEHPELSPVMLINTRSAVRPVQLLISKIDLRSVDHFYQQYIMGVQKDKNDDNQDYFNYTYTADGYVSEDTAKVTETIFERFKDIDVEASDETDDAPDTDKGGKAGGKVGGKGGKF